MASEAHGFNPEYAIAYGGVEEAVMIQSFQWWLRRYRTDGDKQFEGRTWGQNTYSQLQALFPYWDRRKVIRLVESLIEKGVLIRREEKGGANYYAFADEAQFLGPATRTEAEAKGVPKTVPPTPKTVGGGTENCQKGTENGIPCTPNKVVTELLTSRANDDERDPQDEPLRSAEDLTRDDLEQIVFKYNSGDLGPVWETKIRAKVQSLIDDGVSVTRRLLFQAAKNGQAAHRKKFGKAPMLLKEFGEHLSLLVAPPPTRTHTTDEYAPLPQPSEAEYEAYARAELARLRAEGVFPVRSGAALR